MGLRFPRASVCVLLGACAPLLGCGSSSIERELELAVASFGQPIQGGYVDEADTAVLGIGILAQASLGGCSGTLIAPNVVLTAQHCVAEVVGGPGGSVICGQTTFGATHSPSGLFVTTDTEMTFDPSRYHQGAEVVIPPGGNEFCGRDQAILILSVPYDAAEVVPVVPRVDEAVVEGEEYSAIGYGATSDSPGASSGTRYRRDGLFVECVAQGCSFQVETTEWQGDTGVCSGDSGGPAVDTQGRVTGVVSRGGAGCTTPIYGHVHSYSDWIKETTVYAAGLMQAEPPAWATGWPTDPAYSYPVGDACESPDECPSQLCVDGYCTRLCSDLAPCPEGFHCDVDASECRKDEEPPPPPPPPEESEEESSCGIAVGPSAEDPTQPIPWAIAAGALAALAAFRRRRRH